MKIHGGKFHAFFYVKEANLKGLHTVMIPSIINSILKKANPRDSKNVNDYQGLVGETGRAHRIVRAVKLFYMILW